MNNILRAGEYFGQRHFHLCLHSFAILFDYHLLISAVFIPQQCKSVQRATHSAAQNRFRSILQNQLDDIHEAGTYKNERIITSPQDTTISVLGSYRKMLNFCANNYLGLSVCIALRIEPCDIIVVFFSFRIIRTSSNSANKCWKNMALV